MQHHLLIATFLALFALMALGIPAPTGSSISNEAVSGVSPVVLAHSDGSDIVLNGTVEEAYAQQIEANPNNDEDRKNEPGEAGTLPGNFGLEAYTLRCSQYYAVEPGPVKEGIKYLRKVGGKPHLGRGPRKCGRVSCSWDTGIFWCNDDTKPRSLPSFNNIADGAQVILSRCCPDLSCGVFSGELNHPDKWRAVVQRAHC
ncbi:uncharacterized protein BJX67DRAFT_348770 [Aspergillus lucknowensis]|uniref:Secreted protein n=1 Tax=Aspergillus lucknowensis TaxID=176173 RepID=A0ABR4LX24_9EURO